MTKTKIIETICNELSTKLNSTITAEVDKDEKTRYIFLIDGMVTTISVNTEYVSGKKREIQTVIDMVYEYLKIQIKQTKL
jgi:hypothetical protein